MKVLNTLLCALIFSTCTQAQKFEWLKTSHTTPALNNKIISESDAQGNLYSVGAFQGDLIYDTDTTMSPGGTPYFLTKLDATGGHLWSKWFIASDGSHSDICIDANGYVYVSIIGYNSSTYQDTDTTFSLTPLTGYIISFDNIGKLRWVLSGYTGQVVPLAASKNQSGFFAASSGANSSTIYHYDSDGNVIWTKSPTTLHFSFSGISCNDNSSLAVSGFRYSGSSLITLDTVSVTLNTEFTDLAVFLMDTSGSVLWGKVLPGASINAPSMSKMAINSISELYFLFNSGSSNFTYYFANDTLFNNVGFNYSYGAVLKFGSDGTPLWASGELYSNGSASFSELIINNNSEIVVTGSTTGQFTTFGPFNFDNSGGTITSLIGKIDALGAHLWLKSDSRLGGLSFNDEAADVSLGINNTYNISGWRQVNISPQIFNLGCHFDSSNTNGFYFTNISENVEPVPEVDFTILQSGEQILFKNTSQNATSIQWDFGDASFSGFNEPIHSYSQPGVYNVCLSASNNCGTAKTCKPVVIKGISSIDSDHGEVDAVVTSEILGGGFSPTTTVLLKKSGSADIVPYFTQYINDGKLLVRLDLSGQAIGLWDVEVTVPGDTTMTLVNGFTINSITDYDFDITNEGPSMSRPNRWIPSKITVHNRSNKDAVGVLVFYRMDATWNTVVNTSFSNPQQNSFLNIGYQYLTTNSMNTSLLDHTFSDGNGSTFGAFMIPLLKANSSYTLGMYMRGTVDIQTSKIISIGAPLLEPSTLVGNTIALQSMCWSDLFKQAVEKSLSLTLSSVEWDACFPSLIDSLYTLTALKANDINNNQAPVSLPAVVTSMLTSIASSNCITGVPTILSETQIESVIIDLLKNVAPETEVESLLEVCPTASQLREKPGLPSIDMSHKTVGRTACFVMLVAGVVVLAFSTTTTMGFAWVGAGWIAGLITLCFTIASALDPNYITGPGNNADDIFLRPSDHTTYTIEFENVDSATASAQVVIVTDTLDATRFDFSTFRFRQVTIGDSLRFNFDKPGNTQLNISALPTNPDYLRTEATFDTTTGIIKWIFTTVDPVNFQPDTNAFSGFLPPNVNGTEGTGYVSYDVKLKSTLVTGDSINNKAQIIFDTNAPINTNNWLNVIDIDNPVSSVNALPTNVNTTSFLVSWGGSDFVSGIRSYDIYVSVNDQPYEVWLVATDTTQYTYTGVNGSKYEFVSVATDNANNEEDAPADPANFPDAVTTVLVGIDELSALTSFEIFPNPAEDNVIIQFNLDAKASMELKLIDLMGKNAHTIKKAELSPGQYSEKIDLENMAKGIYFVEIFVDQKFFVRKLVKR